MADSILLIHPSNKSLGGKDNLFTYESLTPSLGLACLAAFLRENGYKVKILDLRLPHHTMESVIETIKVIKPLLVGLSAFTNEIVQAGKVADLIKKNFSDLPIAVGGPHASALPEETLKEFPAFDICVVGEGEAALKEVADLIKNRGFTEGLNQIKGISFKLNNKIILNPPRQELLEIDKLPFPAWDLFELDFYNKLFIISTSRGCPYKCYFCNPNYMGKKVRLKQPGTVVAEIEYVVNKFNAKKIQFGDATLSLLGEKTISMCDELIEKGISSKVEWDCETRADAVNEEILRKMREAGCRWLAFGVETGDERMLKDIVKKGESKDDIIRAVKIAKKVGLKVRCFFIIGHYQETAESIKKTINFALELNPDALSFGLMVPNPGSEIRALAQNKANGMKIRHNQWNRYNQFNYDCYELSNLSLDALKKWRSNAYFTFYLHHPLKALGIFASGSGYNYRLKTLLKVLPEFLIAKFKKS